MGLFWWQWILVIFFIICYLFFWAIVLGIYTFMKHFQSNPRYRGYWFDDKGALIEERAIKPSGTDWKSRTSDRIKVRFFVRPRGVFAKAEPKDWPENNYKEISFAGSKKKIVFFNLRGLDKMYSLHIEHLHNLLNRVAKDHAEHMHSHNELKVDIDAEVDKTLKRAKSMVPFPTAPAKKK